MIMIISTVFATILFMLIRLFDRGSIDISVSEKPDDSKDYISSETT